MKQHTGYTLYNSEYRSLEVMLDYEGSTKKVLEEMYCELPDIRTDKILIDMALKTGMTDERFAEVPVDENGKPIASELQYVQVDDIMVTTANYLLQQKPDAVKNSMLTDTQKQELLTGDFSNTGDYLRETYRVLEQGPNDKHGYLVMGMTATDSPTDSLANVERSIGNYTGDIAFDMTLRNGRNSNRFLEASMTDGKIDRNSFKTLDAIEGYNTNVTNKFLLYSTAEHHYGFVSAEGELVGNDLQKAGIFSYVHDSMSRTEKHGGDDILIPLTQELIDALPFELDDTKPSIPHSHASDCNNAEALKGDFVVLTEYGFYDEKYNSMTKSSRPQVKGFDLDYANLYNMEQLQQCDTVCIIETAEGVPPIIVPITERQQQALQKLPEFSSEKEPHGFFMKPLGPAEHDRLREEPTEQEKEEMKEFAEALDALGMGEKISENTEELPWDEDNKDFASAVESLQETPDLAME